MDYLDYYESDIPKYKKSDRMRSWYLYEQFKSLESNQLDAARKLKDRSYQDRILRQELSERKARRILYDQVGPSHSESEIERVQSASTRTSLNDDFFEDFLEPQDEGLAKLASPVEACSQDSPQTGNCYEDDFKNAVELISDFNSCAESVNSVISVESSETITENLKKYVEIQKEAKLEDAELDFDEIKQKLQSFERLTQLKNLSNLSDIEDSLFSVEKETKQTIRKQKHVSKEIKHIIVKDKTVNTPDNNINLLWTKLVSFAYQIMDSKHGNLYYDYGSQLLTAVLACDVLRRGINRMCHILQPYVSPIKFTADFESTLESNKICIRKKPQRPKKLTRHYKRYTPNNSIPKTRPRSFETRRWLENWDHLSIPFFVDNKYLQTSEPWRRYSKLMINGNLFSKSSYPYWPFLLRDKNLKNGIKSVACTCGCPKVVNPMLRLSIYLDQILRDFDDPLLI